MTQIANTASSLGKGRNLNKVKDWSILYVFFAYMTKELMFFFLITSLIVVEVFPALSDT